jgi:ABC-type maltose transport system permease subunit
MMKGGLGPPVPIQAAAVVLATVAPVALFIAFQRRVTLGVTPGAVKG